MGTNDLTQLTPWRAALARARTRHRADALVELPDADRVVPELPVQILYEAVAEIGLHDAGPLLELATPEQVQGLLDLDAWERDHVRDDRFLEWLTALAELGPEVLGRAVRGLDPEVVALFLRRHADIVDLTMEGTPEDSDTPAYPTPDHFFWLAVDDEGEAGKSIERLVDLLYRYDADFARRLVQAAKWELDSDLEETSYRWRSGRMADLGFADYYEALEVYRFLDPASVRPGEATADPPAARAGAPLVALTGQFADGLGGESFFGRVMACVTDAAELERLQLALATLCNRVLAADRVTADDREAANDSLARVRGFLSLGLEFLGRGDPAAGAGALRSVAIQRVFRLGVSLTLKLRRLLDLMAQSLPVTLAAGRTTLLDDPFGEIAAALLERPPRCSRLVDEPPAAGRRPFASLDDVARVTTRIEEAAAMAASAAWALAIDPARLRSLVLGGPAPSRPDEIRLGDLVRTAAVRYLGGGRLTTAALGAADVERFLARAVVDGKLAPAARARFQAAWERRLRAARKPTPPRLASWLEAWLAPLEEHVTTLVPPVDPRLVAAVLVAPPRARGTARPRRAAAPARGPDSRRK